MNDTFLKACRGEEVPHIPVWLMRQAGRYLPEYQAVRSGIDFLTLCKTPKLAAEVTLQPIDILGVDAAILFSDILVVPEAMGMALEFHDKSGPLFPEPVRDRAYVEKLKIPEPEADLPYVYDTIRLLSEKLKDRVPLIGFAGAPFTLATYMIEGSGSKSFVNTKKMMFTDPKLFSDLMDKITTSVITYLSAQVAAGAQALQMFDTWAGILAPDDYRAFELPYVKRAVTELKKLGVPVIYFVNGTAGLVNDIKDAGADVYGVDWKMDLADAITGFGADTVVQGNIDPTALFLPEDKLRSKVRDILQKGKAAKGHVFNLGHGILPETPVEGAKALVRAVHELSKK